MFRILAEFLVMFRILAGVPLSWLETGREFLSTSDKVTFPSTFFPVDYSLITYDLMLINNYILSFRIIICCSFNPTPWQYCSKHTSVTEGTVLEEMGLDVYKKGLWGNSCPLEAFIAQCFNDAQEVHFAHTVYMCVPYDCHSKKLFR
jgi:hypothetical protein